MYANYTYNSGPTGPNIISDLSDILTGATGGVTGLSSTCNQAATFIDTSSTAAGWELYDTVSTTSRVFRAPWHASNGSGYNYVQLTWSNNLLQIYMYETWNTGTNVGTNSVSNTGNNNYMLYIGTGTGSIQISSCNGHSMMFFGYNTATTVYGTGQSTSVCNAPVGMLERTRKSPWDTNDNAYPVSILVHGNAAADVFPTITYTNRIVNNIGSDIAPVSISSSCPYGAISNMPTTTVPNGDKTPQHMLVPLYNYYSSYGFLGGNCSTLTDFWLTTRAHGSVYDEAIVDGNTYIIWTTNTTSSNYRMAVRKG